MELNREIDDGHLKTLEKTVKNKFRWHWLEATVEISVKGERKTTPLIEWIRKIDVPGKAKCILCDKIINYSSRGRVSLTEHCKSNAHFEKLNIKSSNYTLGVSKPNVNSKSYEIHPFCSLEKIYSNQKLIKPLFLWIKELPMQGLYFIHRLKAFLFAKKYVLLG